MLQFFKLYAIALPIFFIIDMAWLGFFAQQFYKNQIGTLLKPNVNWVAAIFFYLIFLAGILFFVVQPALQKQSLQYAVYAGAAFGFVCYATYDLTNLAVTKDWPLTVTIVDLLWGSILCATVASSTYWIAQKLA